MNSMNNPRRCDPDNAPECSPTVKLETLKVGEQFTFPEGTEDAGVRFTVIEQNTVRALCVAQIGTTFNLGKTFAGTEEVVTL